MIVNYHSVVSLMYGASFNTSDTDSSDVIVIVDGRNEELERSVGITLGSRDIADYCVKERVEIFRRIVGIQRRCSGSAAAEQHRQGP